MILRTSNPDLSQLPVLEEVFEMTASLAEELSQVRSTFFEDLFCQPFL
jgi:hypothetical protein